MKDYDRRVRLETVFRDGDYIFVENLPLFRLAAESSASERHSELLPRRQGPHKVVGVDEVSPRILQGGLENADSIQRAALSHTPERYCVEVKVPTEQEPRLETHSGEGRKETDNDTDNMYVINKVVRLLGSGPHLRYVVR